jgi:hypothetical protein
VVLEVLKGAAGEISFRINQQAVSREVLPGRLARIYANRAQRVVFVKGDDKLKFTQIADVIDISRAVGVDCVGLLTPKLAAALSEGWKFVSHFVHFPRRLQGRGFAQILRTYSLDLPRQEYNSFSSWFRLLPPDVRSMKIQGARTIVTT